MAGVVALLRYYIGDLRIGVCFAGAQNQERLTVKPLHRYGANNILISVRAHKDKEGFTWHGIGGFASG